MAFYAFRETPLGASTRIGRVFKFTGNGVQTSFPVTSGLEIGEIAQIGATQVLRALGGFTVSGNNVIFATAPANGAAVIIPERTRQIFRAYDQNSIPNEATPRVDERELWVGDVDEIQHYTYQASTGNTGIKIQYIDLDAANGAVPGWIALAPSLADGTPGTYGSAGAALEIAAIKAYSTVAVNASAGATSITLADATDFVIGQYVQFEPTTLSVEALRVINKVGNVLTLFVGTGYPHLIGANVYACATKVWAKLTVPSGASGGNNINLFDTVPQITYDQVSRS